MRTLRASRLIAFFGASAVMTWPLAACLATLPVQAQEPEKPPVGPDGRVRVYKLETVELIGTTRVDAITIERNLGLTPGIALGDDLVMTTRQRLLGLGLFRNVLLFMKKGSKPGFAKLVIEAEDDETVLSDWGLGGEFGVTHGEPRATAANPNQPPLGYRIQLIGRNLFSNLHRASVMWDVDSEGEIREAQLAYGFPRFSGEDVQFDAQASAVDVATRYLDAMGFGARAETIWSKDAGDLSKFQYGVAMYLNRKPRFLMPGFPETIAGPKVAYSKETRLLGFFPSSGYNLAAGFVLAPDQFNESALELGGAQTFELVDCWFTVDARALMAGAKGVSSRLEGRLDIPLFGKSRSEDLSEIFVRLRAGNDRNKDYNLVGSAAVFGVRYHSFGIIAELAVKITKTPKEFSILDDGSKKE